MNDADVDTATRTDRAKSAFTRSWRYRRQGNRRYPQLDRAHFPQPCPPTIVAEIMGRRTHLPSDVLALLREGEGLIDVRTARAAGTAPERLHRLALAGLLARVAEGVYAPADIVDGLAGWALHELQARAFVISCSPRRIPHRLVIRCRVAPPHPGTAS